MQKTLPFDSQRKSEYVNDVLLGGDYHVSVYQQHGIDLYIRRQNKALARSLRNQPPQSSKPIPIGLHRFVAEGRLKLKHRPRYLIHDHT